MNKKVTKKTTQFKEKKYLGTKILLSVVAIFCLFNSNGMYVYATSYGQNFAEWGLNEIYWVGLICVVVGVVVAVIKKAWIVAITFGLGGGIVLVIIKFPDILEGFGRKFLEILGIL